MTILYFAVNAIAQQNGSGWKKNLKLRILNKHLFGHPVRKTPLGKSKRTREDTIYPLTPNDPQRGRTAPLTSKVAFYILIQQIQVLNILNMVYTLRFFSLSSKCSLFHNSNVFGSCIIHILYTGCAKIKKQFRRQKVKMSQSYVMGGWIDGWMDGWMDGCQLDSKRSVQILTFRTLLEISPRKTKL